jgi:hypothetical protein
MLPHQPPIQLPGRMTEKRDHEDEAEQQRQCAEDKGGGDGRQSAIRHSNC